MNNKVIAKNIPLWKQFENPIENRRKRQNRYHINHTFSGPWECKVQNEVGFGSDFVHINVKCEYD
jgi:hypothetical protein